MIWRTGFAALLLVGSMASALGAPRYDHLYAFGDSYSDNGASEALTRSLVARKIKDAQELPGPLYWQGRWSNGPTAVESLAEALKTPLTDYAVGGAKSGNGNYYGWMSAARDTSALGQVTDHLAAAKAHKADPNALYFIFISANDFFEWADFAHTEALDQLSQTSLTNIRQAVERLAAAGAKHFMVVGSVDLVHVPAVVQARQEAHAVEFQQALARAMPGMLDDLAKRFQVDIHYFDHQGFSDGIRVAADHAGLEQLDTPCQPTYPEAKPACANPDAYYYWDEWHPTRKAHALAAAAMLKTLQANHGRASTP